MMDCKKLREVLDAYVDRELSVDATAQAEAHIAECNACRRAVENLARLREATACTTPALDAAMPSVNSPAIAPAPRIPHRRLSAGLILEATKGNPPDQMTLGGHEQ